MKTFYIFVGAQGCGKSSLYHYLSDKIDLGFRINQDLIIAKNNINTNNLNELLIASKILIGQLRTCAGGEDNFNFETAYISKSLLKFIRLAKENGFEIETYFIALQDVEMHLDRIKTRVNNGGHNVDEAYVKGNFNRRFKNIRELLRLTDKASLFDNSESLKMIATYKDQQFTYVDGNNPIIRDLKQTLANDISTCY